MEMTMRYFGPGYDSVKIEHIRQVPGVTGVITTLYGSSPGEIWQTDEIRALKEHIESAGLKISGIESVNIHDSIKIGDADRDMYIDNYIKTLERLGEEGICLVCYNFMPVFDWTRSDLAKPRSDGSTVLAYDSDVIDKIDATDISRYMDGMSNGFVLPGWEPERMVRIKELFEMYSAVDETVLFDNLVYFLKAIMPVCERYGIKMSIHPDDPAWPVFGLPRVVTNGGRLLKLMQAVDNPHNGVTLCTGSLSTDPNNDIPLIIRSLRGRIPFAHVRNTRHTSPGVFEESAHLSADGSLDMYEIMSALYDIGFDGCIRPDHGRAIWGEVSMPGYGLYDRAIGASYLCGLWEAISKSREVTL